MGKSRDFATGYIHAIGNAGNLTTSVPWDRNPNRYGSKMIYENKINWKDPAKGGGVLGFRTYRFKSAVLDYQIQVEGELEDIIKRHFRDPEAYETKYVPFKRRIELVRALIGKTPDDGIWAVVKNLGDLRNRYSHSRINETEAGKKEIQKMTAEILRLLKGIRPGTFPDGLPDEGIIEQAHFMVQRFFREINEALDSLGLPKSTPN
jgi:hypothetical protein